MWVIGDWGQSDPWTRNSGVQMTKGEDGLYTGVLTLPKGTRFDLKILKNPTVGQLIWSATRYASVLNSDGAYDFGEFTDNLIPNGNFDEGRVKWTPADKVVKNDAANSAPNVANLQRSESIISDAFVIPPNQTLRLTGYCLGRNVGKGGTVLIQVVSPQQAVLSESKVVINANGAWTSFSRTFATGGTSLECNIKLTNDDSTSALLFDSLGLVSP